MMRIFTKSGVAAVCLSILAVGAARGQVRLAYAQPFQYAVSGMTWDEVGFRVHVENICAITNQDVFIQYASGSGWIGMPMVLEGDYGDHATYTLTLSGNHKEFVVGFRDNASGTMYWDNNGGLNYEVDALGSSGIDAGVVGGNVTLLEAERYLSPRGSPGLPRYTVGVRGFIAVQERGSYSRMLGIRMTTDGWGSFHTVSATYDSTMTTGVGTSDIDVYSFDVPDIGGTGLPVEFAVYDFEVRTLMPWTIEWSWDNNFSNNYSLPLGTAPIH